MPGTIDINSKPSPQTTSETWQIITKLPPDKRHKWLHTSAMLWVNETHKNITHMCHLLNVILMPSIECHPFVKPISVKQGFRICKLNHMLHTRGRHAGDVQILWESTLVEHHPHCRCTGLDAAWHFSRVESASSYLRHQNQKPLLRELDFNTSDINAELSCQDQIVTQSVNVTAVQQFLATVWAIIPTSRVRSCFQQLCT